jgi:hypothetical protein
LIVERTRNVAAAIPTAFAPLRSISSIVSPIVPGSAVAEPARIDADGSNERAVTTTAAPSAASVVPQRVRCRGCCL